ncbi:MAG: acyl-CoA thioesterase [Nitrospinota bacterium]
MDDVLPSDREPALRVLAMPADSNAQGDIFGGWVMSQVDVAGAVEAVRRAKGRVATVAVNSFQFKKPVFIGDLVSCYATVLKVGRTSITVHVEVYSQRRFGQEETVKVTEANIVYVAVDDNRLPREVPMD